MQRTASQGVARSQRLLIHTLAGEEETVTPLRGFLAFFANAVAKGSMQFCLIKQTRKYYPYVPYDHGFLYPQGDSFYKLLVNERQRSGCDCGQISPPFQASVSLLAKWANNRTHIADIDCFHLLFLPATVPWISSDYLSHYMQPRGTTYPNTWHLPGQRMVGGSGCTNQTLSS